MLQVSSNNFHSKLCMPNGQILTLALEIIETQAISRLCLPWLTYHCLQSFRGTWATLPLETLFPKRRHGISVAEATVHWVLVQGGGAQIYWLSLWNVLCYKNKCYISSQNNCFATILAQFGLEAQMHVIIITDRLPSISDKLLPPVNHWYQ